MFSSKSFTVSGLTFRSLSHFEFTLCMASGSFLLFHSFAHSGPVFLAPLVQEALFAP